jgi:hypothetical protein
VWRARFGRGCGTVVRQTVWWYKFYRLWYKTDIRIRLTAQTHKYSIMIRKLVNSTDIVQLPNHNTLITRVINERFHWSKSFLRK